LRTRAEFLAARRGRRLNGPHFLIEALKRPDEAPPRFGLTITRKVGNAVERNRIRRRLREAIRLHAGADMVRGFDYVIVARREILTLPFDELSRELARRVRKTQLAEPSARTPRPGSE
jgi:ribonuclease P protein component